MNSDELKRIVASNKSPWDDNEPPKSKTGVCVVCKGEVSGKFEKKLSPNVDHRMVPIGPGGRQYYSWQFQGYNCQQCGLMYKFPPVGEIKESK